MAENDLPDAPWVTSPSDSLPDAPWYKPKQHNTAESAITGALDTAGFGLGPALSGLGEASGYEQNEAYTKSGYDDPLRPIVGAARMLHEKVIKPIIGSQPNPEVMESYERGRKNALEDANLAREQHPTAYLGGQIAGALAMPAGTGARAATWAGRGARSAIAGGIQGGAYGAGEATSEGESPINITKSGLRGAGTGAVLGAAGSGAAELLSPIAERAANVVRGLTNRDDEASRRIATALTRDWQSSGVPLSREEISAANAAGTPRYIADAGGETTRALARSAANTSPEARAALNDAVYDRFQTQSPRISGFIRNITGGANAGADLETLQNAARQANRPAYRSAYQAGSNGVWTPELERIVGSPSVRKAMENAVSRGKDRAIVDGMGAFNPGVSFENGVLSFGRGRGVPPYPDVQFWDYTQRELRDMATSAQRAGRNEEYGALTGLRRQLLNEVDTAVPEFGNARRGAAQFFGADNALEAGEKFVTYKPNARNDVATRQALSRMSSPERELFARGYASKLASEIERTSDNRNVANSAFVNNGPARQRTMVALGPQRAAQLEALIRAEGIVDRLRNSVTGNSTTARQLMEMGLAGAGEGLFEQNFNPSHILGSALLWGAARHGTQVIDRRVAERVGQMLTSNDPAILARGLQLVTTTPPLINALRSAFNRIGYGATVATKPQQGFSHGGKVLNSAIPVKGINDGMSPTKSRKDSHYSPTRGVKEHHCGICKFFVEKNKCSLVGGFIAKAGGCLWYQPKDNNRASGGRTNFEDGGDPELSPEDQQLSATMTHQPEQPNTAKPVIDFAKNFYEGGLHQAIQGTGTQLPEWSNKISSFLNNPAANTALGMIDGAPTYSAAGEAVRNAKAQVMQPSQWLGYLKNQPGVKAQELEHVGLEPWLKEKSGPVSKDELDQFVQSKQPEIKEVRYGQTDWDKIQPYEDQLAKIKSDKVFALRANDKAKVSELAQQQSELESQIKSMHNPAPQYGEYQLPGGENYGETLLTLPHGSETPEYKALSEEAKPLMRFNLGKELPDGRTVREKLDEIYAKQEKIKEQVYQSSHWQEPNVLLHVRHNDRDIPGQGKSLHLEELQSDWHQSGRKNGYDIPIDPSKYEVTGDGPWVIRNKDTGDFVHDFNNKTHAEGYLKDIQKGLILPWKKEGLVPDAPFKQTWPDLALKRMLHRATTEKNPDGSPKYDMISWTPGKEHNNRYPGRPDSEQKGMEYFYDKMLPDKANSLTKKYGTKAAPSHIEVTKTNTKPKYGQNPNYTAKEPIWRVPITPELRKAAEKGFSTFYQGGRVSTNRASGGRVTVNPKIDKSYDIQWVSVLSRDGKTFYRDRSLPKFIKNNGKILDIDKALIEHEKAEYAAMQEAVNKFKDKHGREPNDSERQTIYLTAHKDHGEVAERKYIETHGYSWNEWNRWTKGQIERLEKKTPKKTPKNSDVAIFPHGKNLGTTLRADGGRVQGFDEGGDVEPIESSAPPVDTIREAMRPFIPHHDPIIPEGDTRQSLTEYHPSVRDKIARALLGDSPSFGKEQFVQGSIGSRGLGNTGPSLADFTPAGIPLGMEEAARSRDPAAMAMAVAPPIPGARALKGELGVVGGRIRKLREAGEEGDLMNAKPPEEPLEGLPKNVNIPGQGTLEASPLPIARKIAREYMDESGLPYNPPKTYSKVDPERAKKIAQAYDEMPHDLDNETTQSSYKALADETMAQWKKIKDSGLNVDFIKGKDPYEASPRLAVEDVKNNNHMWVYPTESGYGESAISDKEAAKNPMLQDSGETISGQPAKINDIFRIVHDYFGHAKEGVGFRADGEENAWRSHAAMYSPLARKAMTTETRGQNSWLNYGPHGESNRTARTPDTVFADQKIGLLPDWVSEEGRHDPGVDVTHPDWIDTRLPTGKKVSEPEGNRVVDLENMKKSPDLYEHNVGLVRDYPNMPNSTNNLSTDQAADHFVNHVKDNLLWLHDQVPPEVRSRSKLWYEGARKIADKWSKEFGIKDSTVAGVMAALSPQMDWFKNVSLARRVLDINKNISDMPLTSEMENTFKRIPALAKNKPLFNMMKGKSLSDIDQMTKLPVEERAVLKAMWTRLYDEAHHSKDYRVVTPEGNFEDKVITSKGNQEKIAWGSLPMIAKAIRSIETDDGRKSMNTIMGMKHKIRNFYNNILAPNSNKGDVTIDTHAVSAGLLRPLAGADLEVNHNFRSYAGKGLPNSKGSSITGIQGTYPLYAEAYRKAAAERNILPREMQSITWEAIRGLFPEDMKGAKLSKAADDIWNEYKTGKASLDETRQKILEAGGGIRNPKWYKPADELNAASRGSSDQGELPEPRLYGPATQAPGGGGRLAAGPKVGGRGFYPKRESADERNYLAGNAVDDAFAKAGMPILKPGPTRDRVIEIVGKRGDDPLDVYERVIMEEGNQEPKPPPKQPKLTQKTNTSFPSDDVPFASGGAVSYADGGSPHVDLDQHGNNADFINFLQSVPTSDLDAEPSNNIEIGKPPSLLDRLPFVHRRGGNKVYFDRLNELDNINHHGLSEDAGINYIPHRALGGRINHDPSEAQKEAGNYKKGHVRLHGLDISIENAKGSTRRGVSKDGVKWKSVLPANYGYIKGSKGADADQIDVYVGPNHNSNKIFVVNQRDTDNGSFDEHKSFIGFHNIAQVKNTFLRAFSDGKGKKRMGHITEMTVPEFKSFIEAETDRNTKP